MTKKILRRLCSIINSNSGSEMGNEDVMGPFHLKLCFNKTKLLSFHDTHAFSKTSTFSDFLLQLLSGIWKMSLD